MDKVLIVNMLMGSLFRYKLQNLHNISDTKIQSINDEIENFVWTGKHHKLNFNILIAPKDKGGLGLFSISNTDIRSLAEHFLQCKDITLLLKANLHYNHAVKLFPKKGFLEYYV